MIDYVKLAEEKFARGHSPQVVMAALVQAWEQDQGRICDPVLAVSLAREFLAGEVMAAAQFMADGCPEPDQGGNSIEVTFDENGFAADLAAALVPLGEPGSLHLIAAMNKGQVLFAASLAPLPNLRDVESEIARAADEVLGEWARQYGASLACDRATGRVKLVGEFSPHDLEAFAEVREPVEVTQREVDATASSRTPTPLVIPGDSELGQVLAKLVDDATTNQPRCGRKFCPVCKS